MSKNAKDKEISSTHIIAVGGGKGGVGKSMFTANMSLLFAEREESVTVVDVDLGAANLHTVLGVARPKATLSDFVSRKVALPDIVVPTKYPNLALISGANDDVNAANPKFLQKMRLLRHLRNLDTDRLILDLGAGTTLNTLDLFLLADDAIVVVLPEPTSVENAYRFLKAAFMRRLGAIQNVYGIREVIEDVKKNRRALKIQTPADLLAYLKKVEPKVGAEIETQMMKFRPWLLLNQAEPNEDKNVAADMSSACRRFFGIDLRVLGDIPYDDNARRAIRKRTPLVKAFPHALATQAMRTVVDRLRESAAADAAAEAQVREGQDE